MIKGSAIIKKGQLTKQNIGYYNEYGFLMAEGLFTTIEIAEIKDEALEIFTGKRALVSHYMGAESLLPWDWDGRLELMEGMRDMMVFGINPYEHKGIKNLTFLFLRP